MHERSISREGSLVPPLLLASLQSGRRSKSSPPASAGSSELGSDETGSGTCFGSESAEEQPNQRNALSGRAAPLPPRGVRGAVTRAAGAVASLWRRRLPEMEQAQTLPPAPAAEQEAVAKDSVPEVDRQQEAKPSTWASHVQASSLDFTPPVGTPLVVGREPQSLSDLSSSVASEDEQTEDDEEKAVSDDATEAIDFDEGWSGGRCGAHRVSTPLGHGGAHGGIFQRTIAQCCWRCASVSGSDCCCKPTSTEALITPRAAVSYPPEDLDPEALHPSIGPGGGTSTSIAKALGGLARLREEGILSDADFRFVRARLLPQ